MDKDSRTLFSKEVTCQLRKLDAPAEQGLNEALTFRVISRPNECLLSVTSEQDLYFNFSARVGKAAYEELRKEQSLMAGYQEFPAMLAKLLASVQREQKQYLAILFISTDGGTGRFEIIENFKSFKYVDILSLPMKCASPEEINRDIAQRYALLRRKNAELQTQVNELRGIIKTRLPNFTPPAGSVCAKLLAEASD